MWRRQLKVPLRLSAGLTFFLHSAYSVPKTTFAADQQRQHQLPKMPPKRIVHVEKAVAARPRQPKGFFQSTYESLTSASNATVVRDIGVFGVSLPDPLFRALLLFYEARRGLTLSAG